MSVPPASSTSANAAPPPSPGLGDTHRWRLVEGGANPAGLEALSVPAPGGKAPVGWGLLKGGHDCAVWAGEWGGRPVVAKVWTLDSPRRRVQAILRRTPAFRHWRGAAVLQRAGLATAPCLAICRRVDERGRRLECLIMERLEGCSLLHRLAAPGPGVAHQHRLARAVGRQVAQMADLRVFNRDHKPSNLIVVAGDREAETQSIAIIDCSGVARRRPRDALPRMLTSLVTEAIGAGAPPRLSVRMRVLSEAALHPRGDTPRREDSEAGPSRRRSGAVRNLWLDVQRRFEAHGDPTPKVDPLARPREG